METVSGIDIANNIRAERNRVKLTQKYVAEKLGVSLKTYIKYENDAENITAPKLCILSKIFKCSIENFYVPSEFTECELTETG